MRTAAIVSASFIFLRIFNPCTAPAQVILNEIMYNPDGPEHTSEYIELYNIGPDPVDLAGWQITDGSAADSLITAPNDSLQILQPTEYALILDNDYWDDDGVYDGRIPDGTLLLTVPDAALGSGGLTNSSAEPVALIDASGDTVSQRTYIPGAPGNVSEERIDFDGGEGDDNWTFSLAGGSPGYRNTSAPVLHDLAVDTIRIDTSEITEGSIIVSIDIVNRGADQSEQRELKLQAAQLPDSAFRALVSWSIGPVEAGATESFTEKINDYTGGMHLFRALLDPAIDANSANDTLTIERALPYTSSPLYLSELLPAPAADNPAQVEWVEIYMLEPVPLRNLILSDAGGHAAEFTEDDRILDPQVYYVFAQDESVISWPGLHTDQIIVPASWPSLNNGGDTLRVHGIAGDLLDEVHYEEAGPGRSYAKSQADGNWQWTPDPPGPSPGERNSDFPPDKDIPAVPSVSVEPNPFSPDGDGHEDITVFNLRFPTEQVEVEIRIYDVRGRLLGTIFSDIVPGISEVSWDGRSGLSIGRTLPLGQFVYLIRADEVGGTSRWQHKGVIVSTGA